MFLRGLLHKDANIDWGLLTLMSTNLLLLEDKQELLRFLFMHEVGGLRLRLLPMWTFDHAVAMLTRGPSVEF